MKKIIVRIAEGLGNQLFMYSHAYSLSKKLGLPQKLREVNIPKEACIKMAKDAMKQTRLLVNNPREVTEKDALNIYESAW